MRTSHSLVSSIAICAVLAAAAAHAQQVPTSPPVNFANSTSVNPGTVIPNVLDSYAALMQNNPAVMIQNYQTVVTMTQNRTDAQTLAAIHDDRTSQQYSVENGLGALTSLYLTGAAASASGTAPAALTPTTYASATLQNYQANINYLTNASAGSATFSTGAATPLANAVNFVNNVARANSSTEPPKRTFERYMGANPTINPLDPRYANYNVVSNPHGLSPSDTANFVVPSYLSSFTTPAPYGTTANWVKGFTVTQAMIDANGGQPLTAPNLGTFDANGTFAPATFGLGAYVPGIGTAPRPYRVSTAVAVPSLLYPVINSTNPYADGAFPSGHTNSAYSQAIGLSFLIPQQGQELFTRAADLGNNRILAGMHSPLDVMGGRMEATAITATNIYAALYDANGNRVDWTNPANTSAYAVYQAVQTTQAYLASACGTTSVAACIAAANASGANANDPYGNAAQNKANYTAELTYGFQPIGPVAPMTAAQVPLQAQVLLLTRFPYLSDAQRTEVLATTGLPSGYPLLSGNTYNGWGQLNLYAAYDGYGAFNAQTAITMNAALGGYNAADTYANAIGGTGGLTLGGTGILTLSGADTYTGPTIVNGGTLQVSGSIVSATTVNAGGVLAGSGTVGAVTVNSGGVLAPGSLTAIGTMNAAGSVSFAPGSVLAVRATATQADKVVAASTAALGGGTVAVQATGTFVPQTRYTILTALGGVSGAFSGTTSNLAFLTPTLSYDANDAFLTLSRNDVSFVSAATTPNQRNVANALTNTGAQPTTVAGGALLNTVFSLSGQQAPGVFDQLSGEGLVASESANIRVGRAFSETVSDQLTLFRSAQQVSSATHELADMPAKAQPLPRGWRIWSSGFGSGTHLSGNPGNGIAGETGDAFGGVLGTDYQVQPGLLLGAALGGSGSDFSVSTRATSGSASGFHASAYGLFTDGQSYVLGQANFGGFSNQTTRSVGGFGAFGLATERASFASNEIRGRIEAGRGFAFDQGFGSPLTTVTPFAALEIARLATNPFTEYNTNNVGNGLGLTSFGATTTDVPGLIGLRVDSRMTLGGIALRPVASLAYLHEFAPSRNLVNGLVALPGSTFLVQGARPASNAAQVKLGGEAALSGNLGLFANFDGEFSGSEQVYGGKGGLRFTW